MIAAASFVWSPTSEGFYLETRRVRGELSERERAKKNAARREVEILMIIMIRLLKPCVASRIINPRNTALIRIINAARDVMMTVIYNFAPLKKRGLNAER